MDIANSWPWLASAILFLATLYSSRQRFARRIEGAVSSRGFADDSENVTLVLADGTTIKTTWGAIKKRVTGDRKYLLSSTSDWVIGGIYCVISIAIPFAIEYFLRGTSG